MASIQKKGLKVQWICALTRKRKSKWFTTKATAMRFAAEKEREAELIHNAYLDIDDLEKSQRRSTPLPKLIDDYEAELEKRQGRPEHRREVIRAINAIVEGCRIETVRDLDPRVIAQFLQRIIASGRSARTHNHYRAALSGFCRWLVGFRYLDYNPVDVVRSLDQEKDKRRPSRALAVAETDALVAATICPRRQALYLFRLRTGLRVREASRLVWSDLNLVERVICLRAEITKNGKADLLPLTDDVCELLVDVQRDALRAGCPARPDSSVFGPPPDRRTWSRDLRRAGIKDKLPEGQADPKCLRKTFDSLLTRADVDLTLVSLLMRHTPSGGMKLTLGVYGDQEAILGRKRDAIDQMIRWIEAIRRKPQQAVATTG